ncbi:MAG: NAD(P)H-dependent oxidoreductase [Terracidiphilus sp.]|jgi:putative NADPH-quinone reductase
MEISVILAHPEPASFNHAIAHTACDALERLGHTVCFHDLYEEGFDPLLPSDELASEAALSPSLKRHCEELQRAEGLIIVHPNWWGQPPAMMKGWIDRVFRPGVAYQFEEGDNGEGVPVGLLRAQAAVIFNTSNTPPAREQQVFGDPLDNLWKRCIFDFCGVKNVVRETFSVVITSTPEQRAAWLSQVEQIVTEAFT